MNPHSAVGVSCRRNACYRSLFCILITASSEILPKCNIAVNSNCSNVAEVYCNTKMSLLWLIKRLEQNSGIQQSHDWSFSWSIILLPFTLTFLSIAKFSPTRIECSWARVSQRVELAYTGIYMIRLESDTIWIT